MHRQVTANSSSSINQELTVFRETTVTREAERYFSIRSCSVSLSERAAPPSLLALIGALARPPWLREDRGEHREVPQARNFLAGLASEARNRKMIA